VTHSTETFADLVKENQTVVEIQTSSRLNEEETDYLVTTMNNKHSVFSGPISTAFGKSVTRLNQMHIYSNTSTRILKSLATF